jgi:ubiquinol-cytochrome c reductase cytochrome c1 subunit
MIASACRCAAQQQQQQQRGAGVEIDQAVLEAAAGAEESVGMKGLRAVALLGAGATGLLGLAGLAHADEAEHGLSAPDYPWPHNGILSSYDHSSIRRGHQVNIIMSRFWILFSFFFSFSPVAECCYSLAFCLSVNSEDGLEGS